MNKIKVKHLKNVKNHILKAITSNENLKVIPAQSQLLASLSHAPNKCSFPKNDEHIQENVIQEKVLKTINHKLKNDLATLTNKSLQLTYRSEYKAWSNSKNRIEHMKGIKGVKYDDKFESFVGFLNVIGAKPNDDDSLDRIDPEFGYTEFNVRWASKQLQSENRKIVNELMVDGKPMTLTKIANHIGIQYDALRMRLRRGDTLDEILNQHKFKLPLTPKSKKSVSEWPWPEGKEDSWEQSFKAEAGNLCPHNPKSRCNYFVEKCTQKIEYLKEECLGYAQSEVPKNLLLLSAYWVSLRKEAVNKLNLAIYESKFRVSLGPTEEELEMRYALGL